MDPWDGFFLCFGKICSVLCCTAALVGVFVVLALARRQDRGDPSDGDDGDPGDELELVLLPAERRDAPPEQPAARWN